MQNYAERSLTSAEKNKRQELKPTKNNFETVINWVITVATLIYAGAEINKYLLQYAANERVESRRTRLEELQLNPEDVPLPLYRASRSAGVWNTDEPLVRNGGEYDWAMCTVLLLDAIPFDHDNNPKTQNKAYAVISSIGHCLDGVNRIRIRDHQNELVDGKVLTTTSLNDEYEDPSTLALVEFPKISTILPIVSNYNLGTLDTTKDIGKTLNVCGHPASAEYKKICETVTIIDFQEGVAILDMITSPADSGAPAVSSIESELVCTIRGSLHKYDPNSPTICSLINNDEYKNISDLFAYGTNPKNMIKDTKLGKKTTQQLE